ncbi:hypothetical protein K469DRAFT_709137 [Zopfia rhizophila CBS 207.26]|uniref:Uncharacterized protein n=1 Tax=Zopfia rhizophila CBS 207.26 TaxID=1314779 RepID=A0A6A6E2N8_9PEZI|nr:hypothetical protein K469DRAFT_709137 [Zopfia rhizophila CBS 207.26]
MTLRPTTKPSRLSKRFSRSPTITNHNANSSKRESISIRLSLSGFRRQSHSKDAIVPTRIDSVHTNEIPTQPSAPPKPQPQINYTHDPLQNYIPCLYPHCSNHYLPSSLGPTYYSPKKPYGLRNKRGLCPNHASKDLKAANEQCKKERERTRQKAGRKTLGMVEEEFESWMRFFNLERVEESKELERRQRVKVVGWDEGLSPGSKKGKRGEGDAEEWDWKYALRPCTKKGCKREWYSPFDEGLFRWYSRECKFGLRALEALCPACAKEEIEATEKRVEERTTDVSKAEWENWLANLKNEREVEREFWDKAQGRVVRERGMQPRAVEGKEPGLEGKGVETLKELCVVM